MSLLEVALNKVTKIILISLVLLLVTSINVAAQSDADCVTSKCHADMGTKEFVHGPVGAKICTICHTPQADKKHKFEFSADKEELCFSCHEAKRDMMLEDHLHTPVSDGNCVGCHDPHQSDYRFTLKGSASDLCYQCHDKVNFNKEFVHGPVGVGDCNACHNPHASANEKQLNFPKEELCFQCHKEYQGMMNKRHIHPPVEEDCTNCHNPHANDSKFLLPKDMPDLCYGCHEEFIDFANVEYKHEPVESGDCTKCHDVHASDNPRMFLKPQANLCFSCHEEMGEYVSESTNLHGPVKEGDCNACHNPHGSNNFRILRKYFPEEFYMPYSTENYAICFQCHNQTIALDKKTKTLTDFRDGERNLHFVHVNKDVKGRSCKACHQVHASTQDKHIRTSVPFGKINWELPVTYTKFEDGGKCVVGCHSPKEYHR